MLELVGPDSLLVSEGSINSLDRLGRMLVLVGAILLPVSDESSDESSFVSEAIASVLLVTAPLLVIDGSNDEMSLDKEENSPLVREDKISVLVGKAPLLVTDGSSDEI